eukprot:scaffold64520_cov55-Phaeocystis_antarctica.AAC.3
MADERDDFEKLGFDPSTFAALEADFENTLVELSEPHLERFKAEYETLHRALKKSHESEKRLLKKCRELSTDISATSTKPKPNPNPDPDPTPRLPGTTDPNPNPNNPNPNPNPEPEQRGALAREGGAVEGHARHAALGDRSPAPLDRPGRRHLHRPGEPRAGARRRAGRAAPRARLARAAG